MKTLIIDDEYAYIHDLLFLGKLAYSNLTMFDRLINLSENVESEYAWLEKMKHRAGKQPEELCCFFRVYSDSPNPLKTIFFNFNANMHYRNLNYGGFLEYFRKCTTDPERMRLGLLRFYLPKLKHEGEKWNEISQSRIYEAINELTVNNDIKLSLLGFMYDSEGTCQKLNKMLDNLGNAARELVAENITKVENTILSLKEQENYNTLCEILGAYSPENYTNVYLGVTSLNRYEIYTMRNNMDELMLETGIYALASVRRKQRDNSINLSQLGKVLSEPKRVEALKLLQSRDYFSAEIAEATDTAVSTMSYHMTLCSDLGIVKTYNIGRKTYYKLNYEYLTALKGYINEVLNDLDNKKQ